LDINNHNQNTFQAPHLFFPSISLINSSTIWCNSLFSYFSSLVYDWFCLLCFFHFLTLSVTVPLIELQLFNKSKSTLCCLSFITFIALNNVVYNSCSYFFSCSMIKHRLLITVLIYSIRITSFYHPMLLLKLFSCVPKVELTSFIFS
jgi:hypothetical protein